MFVAHAPSVRRWALRAVGPDDADDVVADTFAVAWARWDDVPPRDEQRRAWLFVVARHKAAHVRDDRRRRAVLAGISANAAQQNVMDVAELVDASHSARDVLLSLSPEDREILILVGVHGLSPQEASAALGCSVTAMTTRLSRARRRAEDAMAQHGTPDRTVEVR